MAEASSYVVGVDLGGTKTEVAVLERSSLRVLFRERVPTPQADGYEAVLQSTAALVETSLRSLGVSLDEVSLGVGMPGGIERRTGFVKNSNTVCLNGRPFRQQLSERLRSKIQFDNDANCFALAETILGAAKPWSDGVVFGVIMGTGVGGGVVLSGRVWSGIHGIAGEWGHHSVFAGRGPECYCGKRGCMETFASGPALERAYEERTGKKLALAHIAQQRNHDAEARFVIDGLLDAFGRGLANVIDVLDPSAIVLGGGLSNLDFLYTEGRERVAREVFNDELLTPIVAPTLGDAAGVFGAALLAR